VTTSTDRRRGLASLAGVLLLVAACSNAGAGATSGATTAPTQPAISSPDVTAAPPTAAPGTAAPSQAALSDTVNVATDSSGGEYLVAANGMSLYLFKPDDDDKSNCSGDCATAWPPYTVADGAVVTHASGITGVVGTFKRDDGSIQVTINQQPLYFFSGDSAAGDVNGQGVNEVWYLVQPSGEQVPGGGKGRY
jgi:predicted lipoprotein with Yx(FWY)xxD motif